MTSVRSALARQQATASAGAPTSPQQKIRERKERTLTEAKRKKAVKQYQKEKAKLDKYSNYSVEDIAELPEKKKKNYFSYLDESEVKGIKDKVKKYKEYQEERKEVKEEKDELEDDIDEYKDDIDEYKDDIKDYENTLEMAKYKSVSPSKQRELKGLIKQREHRIERSEDKLAQHQESLAEITGELPEDFDPQAYKRSAVKRKAYESSRKMEGGDVKFVYEKGKLKDINIKGEDKQKTFDIEYDEDKKIVDVTLTEGNVSQYNKQIKDINAKLSKVKGTKKLETAKSLQDIGRVSKKNKQKLQEAKDKVQVVKEGDLVGGYSPAPKEYGAFDIKSKESKLKTKALTGEITPEQAQEKIDRTKVSEFLGDINKRQEKFQDFRAEGKKPEMKAEKLELEKEKKEAFEKTVGKFRSGVKEMATRLSYSADPELSARERYSKGRDPFLRGGLTMLTGALDVGRGLKKETMKRHLEKKDIDPGEEPLYKQKSLKQAEKYPQLVLGAGRAGANTVGFGATAAKEPGVLKQLPSSIIPGLAAEWKYAKRSPVGFAGGLAFEVLADKGAGGALGATTRKGVTSGRKIIDTLTGKRLPIKESPVSGIRRIGDEKITLVPGGSQKQVLEETFKRIEPKEVKIYSRLTTDIEPAKSLNVLTKEQKRLASTLKDTDNVLTGSASERLLVKGSKREVADLDIGTKNKEKLISKIKDEFDEKNITTKDLRVSTQVSHKGKPIADIIDIKDVEGGKGVASAKKYDIEGVKVLEPSKRAQGKLQALQEGYNIEKSLQDYSSLTGQKLDIKQPSLKGGLGYIFKEQAETVKPDIDVVTGQMGLVTPGFKEKVKSFITGEPFYKGRQITVGKEGKGLEQTLFVSPRMRGELSVRETRFLGSQESGTLFDLFSGKTGASKGTAEVIRFKNLDLSLPSDKALLKDFRKALKGDEAAKTRFFQKYEKYQMSQPDKFMPFGYSSSELEATLSKGGTIQLKQKPKITYVGDSRVKVYDAEIVSQKTTKATQDVLPTTKRGKEKLISKEARDTDIIEGSVSPRKGPTKVYGTPEAVGTLGGFSARPSLVSATKRTSIPSVSPTKTSFMATQRSRTPRTGLSRVSQPSIVSEPSQVSRPSRVSRVSGISQPSITSTISEPSIVSEPSQVSRPSKVSRVSGISQPSITSKISEPSIGSEFSHISDISEPSIGSEFSHISNISTPSPSIDISEPSISIDRTTFKFSKSYSRLGGKSQTKARKKPTKKYKPYNVYVKEEDEFVKMNEKTRNKNAALDLGRRATDKSAARTFEVRPARKKAKKQPSIIRKQKPSLRKFNPFSKTKKEKYKNRFIEKSEHAIDSPGELTGITAKGWNKRRKSLNKSLGGKTKMRI